MTNKKLIVFCGGGGKYNYSLGILSVLQKKFDLSNYYFSGASSGSFLALLATMGHSADDFFENWNIRLLSDINTYRIGPLFVWNSKIREYTKDFLPKETYQKVNDRLFIQITCFPSFSGKLVSNWENDDDLIDTLVATSFIPILDYGCITANYCGNRYIDGGISNNCPKPDMEFSNIFQYFGSYSRQMECYA